MFRMAVKHLQTHNTLNEKTSEQPIKLAYDTCAHSQKYSKAWKTQVNTLNTHTFTGTQVSQNTCIDKNRIIPHTYTFVHENKNSGSIELLALNTHIYICKKHRITTSCPHSHTIRRSYIWQPNVPSVAWMCADKPIYSNLPVLCNRGGTKSMGHTTHIKLVLWMLTAITVLGYRRVCVRMYIHFWVHVAGWVCVCALKRKREVKWCHNDFLAGSCLLYASQSPGPWYPPCLFIWLLSHTRYDLHPCMCVSIWCLIWVTIHALREYNCVRMCECVNGTKLVDIALFMRLFGRNLNTFFTNRLIIIMLNAFWLCLENTITHKLLLCATWYL